MHYFDFVLLQRSLKSDRSMFQHFRKFKCVDFQTTVTQLAQLGKCCTLYVKVSAFTIKERTSTIIIFPILFFYVEFQVNYFCKFSKM